MRFRGARRTRRQFIGEVAAAGVIPTHTPSVAMVGAVGGIPTVYFFLGQLHWDPTGVEVPYRPPHGMRSGQPLASLSEEEMRNAFG